MQFCIVLMSLCAVADSPFLCTAEHVAEIVASKESTAQVLDVREMEAYLQGHIPGALNLPLKSLSEKRDGVVNMLKADATLKTMLLAAGVDPGKTIVLYGSGKDVDDMKVVGRMFWILEYMGSPKVAVMNGGLAQWTEEKRKLVSGEATIAPLAETAWTVTPRPDRLATKTTVAQWLMGPEGLLVDSRSADYYQGLKLKEGKVTKKGHIPGATLCPAGVGLKTVLDANGQPAMILIQEPAAIREALGETAQAKRVITYCNSGNSASISYLLYRVAGVDNVAMYDGSMAEWTQGGMLPVENPSAKKSPSGSSSK